MRLTLVGCLTTLPVSRLANVDDKTVHGRAAICDMRAGRSNRSTWRKPAPVPLRPPQIRHKLARYLGEKPDASYSIVMYENSHQSCQQLRRGAGNDSIPVEGMLEPVLLCSCLVEQAHSALLENRTAYYYYCCFIGLGFRAYMQLPSRGIFGEMCSTHGRWDECI
jgi:hypothetical protein